MIQLNLKNKLITSYNKFSFVLPIFFIYFIPRFIYIGRDEWNVDAQRWMSRSDLFVKHLLSGNFAETFQSYHPGTTLMWLSGFSKFFYYWIFEQMAGYSPKLSSGFVYPEQFFDAIFFAKLPLIITISLLLTYSTFLLSKIRFNRIHLFIFALLLSIEPYYLGITRMYHLTGLESAFVFSAVITTWYAIVNKEMKFYLIAGALIGLATATKSSGLIVLPFIFSLIFLYNLKNLKQKSTLKTLLFSSFLLLVSTLLTFVIVTPSIWVKGFEIPTLIFTQGVEGKGFVDSPHKTILGMKYTYYYEIFFVKSLGITLILYIISLIYILRSNNSLLKFIVLSLVLYVIYYFTIMSVPSKQMTRYVSIAYPFAIFGTSYVIHRFFTSHNLKHSIKIISATFLAIYFLLGLYITFPIYTTFHSDLLGGMKGYSSIRKPYNDGEFYLQVAEYLNEYAGKDVKNSALITISDNKDASFRFAFLGHTFTNPTSDKKFKKIFYAVDFDESYRVPENCKLIHQLGNRWPDDFKFVNVFECGRVE